MIISTIWLSSILQLHVSREQRKYRCQYTEARSTKGSVFWPFSKASHSVHSAGGFFPGRFGNTKSLHVSSAQDPSLSFIFTLHHATCCVGLLSDKHHTLSTKSPSSAKIMPSFSPVSLYCCYQLGMWSTWTEAADLAIFLASQREFVPSHELYLEYESAMAVFQ